VKESGKGRTNENIQVGLFYTILLFLTSFLQSLALHLYFHRMFIVGARVRTAIMNLIYKKVYKASNKNRII
jgi:ATP-binding cassette subfamily C (CFTR/MRP) protein 1